MFLDPIARDYGDRCEIVALCDPSRVRMEYHHRRLAELYGYPGAIGKYHANDFDRMLQETRPDAVIICSVDSTHHDYLIRSLDHGCDVICEKPLTVDEEKCRAILEAKERSRGTVRVAFNLRWSPGVGRVRELIREGAVGTVRQVTMDYRLDLSHGADYFRRWHSDKNHSGGLLVHKSTHHFDLVNWWLDAIPSTVYAAGDLVFYGRQNAIARGEAALTQYGRYLETSPARDPFHFDLQDPHLHALYRDAEAETGYIRDRNVFREGITIEDLMSVMVRYRNGAVLQYSLNAFSPQEGFRVGFCGDRGRLEYEEWRPPFAAGTGGGAPADRSTITRRLVVQPLFGEAYEVGVPHRAGGHGGGDVLLKDHLFSGEALSDPAGRPAGVEQGAASALVGIAANRSMATGLPVRIDDLLCLRPECARLSDLA